MHRVGVRGHQVDVRTEYEAFCDAPHDVRAPGSVSFGVPLPESGSESRPTHTTHSLFACCAGVIVVPGPLRTYFEACILGDSPVTSGANSGSSGRFARPNHPVPGTGWHVMAPVAIKFSVLTCGLEFFRPARSSCVCFSFYPGIVTFEDHEMLNLLVNKHEISNLFEDFIGFSDWWSFRSFNSKRTDFQIDPFEMSRGGFCQLKVEAVV